MTDHILGPRARFWFRVHDVARRLRLPWRFQLWCVGRAGKAVNRQCEKMNPAKRWRIV